MGTGLIPRRRLAPLRKPRSLVPAGVAPRAYGLNTRKKIGSCRLLGCRSCAPPCCWTVRLAVRSGQESIAALPGKEYLLRGRRAPQAQFGETREVQGVMAPPGAVVVPEVVVCVGQVEPDREARVVHVAFVLSANASGRRKSKTADPHQEGGYRSAENRYSRVVRPRTSISGTHRRSRHLGVLPARLPGPVTSRTGPFLMHGAKESRETRGRKSGMCHNRVGPGLGLAGCPRCCRSASSTGQDSANSSGTGSSTN